MAQSWLLLAQQAEKNLAADLVYDRPLLANADRACLKILLTGLPDDGDMLRIAAIVLAVAVSYDLYMLGGKYTSVANQMATSILRHFGLL